MVERGGQSDGDEEEKSILGMVVKEDCKCLQLEKREGD